ncbi:MAG: hypothetical protein ACO3PN_08225, partial [Chthoniobacterales bacterium]
RTFSPSPPDIAKCAKRLADEPDLESARRAFMRLNRLMEKHARRMLAARFTRPGVLVERVRRVSLWGPVRT